MTKTKPFARIALHFDQERCDNIIKSLENSIVKINNVIESVEKTLQKKLSNEDVISLISNGKEFIINHYRASFPFENASDEFNLQALGVNLEPILKEVTTMPGISHIGYEVKDGRLLLSEDYITETKEGCTSYTNNERQNQAYKAAEKAVKHLNELYNMGVISKYGINRIGDATSNIIYIPFGPFKGYAINHHGILDIREN